MVPPVLNALQKAAVDFEYIDIRQDTAARLHVLEINNGNESVPTLVFADDSTLTEPGLRALRHKLVEQGYAVESLQGVGAQAGYTLRNYMITFMIIFFVALFVYSLVVG